MGRGELDAEFLQTPFGARTDVHLSMIIREERESGIVILNKALTKKRKPA